MAEDAKTYVFGNSDSSLSSMMAAMNGGGFGGNGAWWVILLIALLGGRGFGGCGGGQGIDPSLISSAISGNRDSIGALASTLNCDVNAINSAISSLSSGIQSVSASLGLTGLQVINAVQSGNASVTSALQTCCCENRLLTTTQGYENRIAGTENTALLAGKIDAQTSLIQDKFCELEKREMQARIDALLERNSALTSLIDNASQTASITSYINGVIAPLSATVAEIKAATPSTVSVPYPLLTAVPATPYCGYGYGYNGSIWS